MQRVSLPLSLGIAGRNGGHTTRYAGQVLVQVWSTWLHIALGFAIVGEIAEHSVVTLGISHGGTRFHLDLTRLRGLKGRRRDTFT